MVAVALGVHGTMGPCFIVRHSAASLQHILGGVFGLIGYDKFDINYAGGCVDRQRDHWRP
jgi:hypothetical protein